MLYFWKLIPRYLKNILIGVDQMVNAITWGDPDETISSRVGKHQNVWICRVLSNFLDLFQKNHCTLSKELDEGKDDLIDPGVE